MEYNRRTKRCFVGVRRGDVLNCRTTKRNHPNKIYSVLTRLSKTCCTDGAWARTQQPNNKAFFFWSSVAPSCVLLSPVNIQTEHAQQRTYTVLMMYLYWCSHRRKHWPDLYIRLRCDTASPGTRLCRSHSSPPCSLQTTPQHYSPNETFARWSTETYRSYSCMCTYVKTNFGGTANVVSFARVQE